MPKVLKIKLGDIEFQVDDEEHLGRFLRAVGAGPAVLRALGDSQDPPADARRALLEVLRSVVAGGPEGVVSATLASTLGWKNRRSLGSASKGWRTILEGLGFEYDEVLQNRRVVGNLRAWHAGPRAQEALDKLEAVLGD